MFQYLAGNNGVKLLILKWKRVSVIGEISFSGIFSFRGIFQTGVAFTFYQFFIGFQSASYIENFSVQTFAEFANLLHKRFPCKEKWIEKKAHDAIGKGGVTVIVYNSLENRYIFFPRLSFLLFIHLSILFFGGN